VVLRQLRYIFDLNDEAMINLFAHTNIVVKRDLLSDWLRKEDHKDYKAISNTDFASFLNGFIIEKRGKREGPPPALETHLNNNIILRKIKIALNYKDTDIIEVFDLVDMFISKHEISSLFRNPKQKQYQICGDQFLRNFLHGLQLRFRNEE